MEYIAATRSKIYKKMSQLMVFPDRKIFEHAAGAAFLEELSQLGSVLPYRFIPMDVRLDLGGVDYDSLNAGYISLFEYSADGRVVRLFEGEIVENRTHTMKELARFYEFFGLQFENNDMAEAPDHLPVELSFMHYLSFREVEFSITPEHQRSFILGQRDFLYRHLSKWVPIIYKGICEYFNNPEERDISVIKFYRDAFALVDGFVSHDLNYLEERLTAASTLNE